jgi:hypothetical protein
MRVESSPKNCPSVGRWHIALADSHPPIWRRFEIPTTVTLAEFHTLIQAVMGWTGDRPYRFQVQGRTYHPGPMAPPAIARSPEAGHPPGDLPHAAAPSTLTLAALNLAPTDKLTYTYDLQNGWFHVLQLEAVQAASPSGTWPCRCVAGERACPPLDAGGVWGYEELLERLNDFEDPEYEELLTWVGFDFDPEKFDLAAANQRLAALQPE